jgi:WD40 repeat protein
LLERFGTIIEVSSDGKYVFIGGYFDFSFRLYTIDKSLRFIDRVFDHLDIVTCLAVSEDGELLATGSRDSTVRLWKIKTVAGEVVVSREGRKIFYAHDSPVTNVIVNTDCHVLVSSSLDGTVVIHPLRHPGSPISINLCSVHQHNRISAFEMFPVNADLLIATRLGNKNSIHRYSINGSMLDEITVAYEIFRMIVSFDGKYIFLSTSIGLSILNEKE